MSSKVAAKVALRNSITLFTGIILNTRPILYISRLVSLSFTRLLSMAAYNNLEQIVTNFIYNIETKHPIKGTIVTQILIKQSSLIGTKKINSK